jgi:hypothetical protein
MVPICVGLGAYLLGRWFGLKSAMATASTGALLGAPPLGAPRSLADSIAPPELKLPPHVLPPHDGLVAPSQLRPPPQRQQQPAAEEADFTAGEAVARDADRLASWAKAEKEALVSRNGGL